ncbi:response regulator [Hyphomicrobium methylovorum]|uniref:response regulator n=1 Tax=Hyphomicrobium methylovorum TaxID=84 RepID=UPI0015E6B66C|nr:response regulator [Hyphomicrobium methylovorum]MBA2127624.1 response regulator [Hyphomicrobium methylovorum]
MSIAQAIRPHLPYLRRFARTLSGTQEAGDGYVATLLEGLVSSPSDFPAELPPRVALYHLFLRVWNSVRLSSPGAEAINAPGTAQQRINSISSLPRQAFLLVAVEGFTASEAATILEIEESDIERLLDIAGQEIAHQVATNVLIIEDELLIAMDLETIVTSLGHTVQDVATTKTEALAAVQRRKPGLVLADVKLADGSSGLDAAKEIVADGEVPIIFITAYPEKVLTGARPEPTFLISKPFQRETVMAIISQALFFDTRAHLRPAAA